MDFSCEQESILGRVFFVVTIIIASAASAIDDAFMGKAFDCSCESGGFQRCRGNLGGNFERADIEAFIIIIADDAAAAA